MVNQTDYCKGPRFVYAAFLKFVASKSVIAGLASGFTVFVVTTFIILQNIYNRAVFDIFSKPTLGIYFVLLASWFLCVLSIWRIMPNLLTFVIFVHNCLGHWSLVSFLLLLLYGNSALPIYYITYIIYGLIPGYLSLIVTVDLLRTLQTNMFAYLESTGVGDPVVMGV